jgi:hypothetical protein
MRSVKRVPVRAAEVASTLAANLGGSTGVLTLVGGYQGDDE